MNQNPKDTIRNERGFVSRPEKLLLLVDDSPVGTFTAHVLKADTGHISHLQQLGSLYAPMTSKDHIVFVDEDWIGEAKLHDAVGDLFHLLLRVGARIARVGKKSADPEVLDI